MAKQNRTTLKTYFEDGDTPSSAEFGELIDSQLNLAYTGDQEVAGNVKVLGIVSASTVGADVFELKGFAFEQVSTSQLVLTGSNTFGSSSTGASPIITSHSFFGPIYQSSSGADSASYFLTPVIIGGTETNLEGEGLHINVTKTIASQGNPVSQSISASLILSSSNGQQLSFDSNEIHHYGNDLHITAQGNDSNDGNIKFRTAINSDSTQLDDTNTRLYISSSGNIGIGTITPKEKLVVEGNISSSGNIISNGNITSSGNINVKGNGSNTFTGNITSSGTISASGAIYASSFVGSANFTGFQLNDNDKLELGNGQDLRLHHDGTDSFIHNIVGNLTISLDTVGNDKDIIFKVDDDEYIRLDSDTDTTEFSKKINIGATGNSNGVDAIFYSDTSGRYMHWDASDNALTFRDTTFARFGNGNDLKIWHNGTDSYLTNDTGDFKIMQNANDKDMSFQCDDGYGFATEYFKLDGSTTTVNFSKKITDSSDVPIIARNIVVDNQSGNGPEISDSGANIYENFRTTGNVQLQCTITTKTINPLFLVSANCAVGAKTEHQSFVAQIILSKGSDSFTTAKFANDSTEATDIACGTTGDDHNKTLCGLPIPNTLVQYTDTSIVAGDEVRVRIQIKCTESNHGYFMNRTENDDFTPHSFLTIEEIPQANG